MSKWSETGILRKKQVKDNFDDLLVFGYACKLFRDDEKAQYIDQGKHLIPWMGDEKLKIDRYDGRGALSDLSSCEASKEGYHATRWLDLSDADRKLEQRCDEERYYSLHTNEEEEALYKEEALKRQKANEYSYSYDVPQDPDRESSQESIPTCEEEVKAYIPPPELDVPADIDIPKTMKENARIEKTALFVSQQGPQMEILIKAKQAENPQFNFMNQSDALYKYYRHVLSAIKSGRYKTHSQKEESAAKEEQQKEDSQSAEEDYLHPSLAPVTPLVTAPPKIPQIPYKPAADCAYAQLVTRIQGTAPQVVQEEPTPPPAQIPQDQQQYYQYCYSMQYYEYYKQIAQQYAAQANCDVQTLVQNPQMQERIQSQAAHYAQASCNQYMQQNAYNTASNSQVERPPEPPKPPEKKPVVKTNPLLSLVHYSSDSDEDEDAEEQQIEKSVSDKSKDEKISFVVPPDDKAAIIDKMANYVAKNGDEFETIVRAKDDDRFDFVRESHKYYKFYRHTIDVYRSNLSSKSSKEKKVIAPVSFSIKKPKEETSKEIKSALPLESDEEEIAQEEEETSVPSEIVPESTQQETPVVEEKQQEESQEETQGNGKPFMDGDDPILEMIDLTDDLEERRDARRAEDKIKDKIALAAKERLVSSTRPKDRALQMDRRKRAAMFLKMKSENTEDSRTITRTEDDEKKEEILKIDDSESEDGEIRQSKRSHKRKKSHKRRRSTTRRESKSHRKKSKKRRRRSSSRSSSSSTT